MMGEFLQIEKSSRTGACLPACLLWQQWLISFHEGVIAFWRNRSEHRRLAYFRFRGKCVDVRAPCPGVFP